MSDHLKLEPGDRVVALSSFARSVGVATAVAAAISYHLVFDSFSFGRIILITGTAILIGVIVGFIASMRFTNGASDSTTTIVKHGRDAIPLTMRTAIWVAAPVTIIFIVTATLGFGFDGDLVRLIATVTVPALCVAAAWALLASLA